MAKPVAKPTINLDQWGNGGAPDFNGTGNQNEVWQNGNLNQIGAHYSEGESIPYRVELDDLVPGTTYALTIQWDTVDTGAYAIDYLTGYNFTFAAPNHPDEPDPVPTTGITDISGADGLVTQVAIPGDPQLLTGFNAGTTSGLGDTTPSGDQFFSIYGSVSGATAGPTYTYATNSAGVLNKASITITFTYTGVAADNDDAVVIAWGGHIASKVAWNPTFDPNGVDTASDISGSPYHMRTIGLMGNGTDLGIGSQDRSLSASAVVAQNPELTITKVAVVADGGSVVDSADDVVNYTITVTNTGDQTLTSVVVSDLVEGSINTPTSLISGDDGDLFLEVGEAWVYTASYDVQQSDIDEGDNIDNVATVDTDQTEPQTASATVPVDQNPALVLLKTGAFEDGDGDGFADVGELINYTFSVQNTGNVTLTNVTVSDPLITVVGGPTTLSVGETDTTTFTGSYAVTQADIDAGTVHNLATGDSDESPPDDDDHDETLPQNPALVLLKTGAFEDGDGDGFADVGELINYTFSVQNTGNVTLTNVTVSDPLITVVGGPTTLSVGETDTTTFTGSYAVTQADIDAGTVHNLATGDSDESPPDDDDHTETLPQGVALVLLKTGAWVDGDDDGFADVGETINYTFSVQNTGNVTLTNVTVEDTVGGVTVVGGPTTLDVGETDTDTFTGSYAITQADIDAGSFYNLATADSDESDPDDDDHDEPLPQNPALVLLKTGAFEDGDGDGFADVGELINYTFSVQNTGNVTLTNVTVSDPLITVVGGPTTLSVGETDTTTFTGSYAVTQADIDAGTVHNLATGDSDESPPDDDDHDETLPQNPDILLTKTNGGVVDLDANGADAGDQIVYDYEVENTGNITLLDVTLDDDQLGDITLTGLTDEDGDTFADDLAVGAVVTGTATATLTQAQVDAGSVSNIAITTGTGTDPNSTEVEDDDDNTVDILQPGPPPLDLVKSVSVDGGSNYFDANSTTGPILLGGALPMFKYEVTNTSNVTLTNLTVEDDNGTPSDDSDDFFVTLTTGLTDVDGDGQADDLAVGVTAVGHYTGTFHSGQYTNIAAANGESLLGVDATEDTDPANYLGFTPITVVGTPQFNFPNDLEKIQPKLQGSDAFIINPLGYISWDMFTSNANLARIDTTVGFLSGYAGLTVSIVEIWNSVGSGNTASGTDAIYRIYVANEGTTSVALANNTNVVEYDILATSTNKGLIDLINSDPLIGNFNSFSNIENAIEKVTNNILVGNNPAVSGGADRVWSSSDVNGTGTGEALNTANPIEGGNGNDAIYGRNNAAATTELLNGGANDDMIEARDGGDTVHGNDGNDRLFGSLGSDELFGDAGADVLFGGYGADELTGGTGNDTFILRKGDFDTILDFQAGDKIVLWVENLGGTPTNTGGHTYSFDDLTDVLSVDGLPVAVVVGASPGDFVPGVSIDWG